MGEESMGDLNGMQGLGASWGDTFKDLTSIFGQTGAKILGARYGTVPVYQTTNSPYGSSQTVYQPGATPYGQSTNSIGPQGASGMGTMVMIGGGILLIILMTQGERR